MAAPSLFFSTSVLVWLGVWSAKTAPARDSIAASVSRECFIFVIMLLNCYLFTSKSGGVIKPFNGASFFCQRGWLLNELQRMPIRIADDDAPGRARSARQFHDARGHKPG